MHIIVDPLKHDFHLTAQGSIGIYKRKKESKKERSNVYPTLLQAEMTVTFTFLNVFAHCPSVFCLLGYRPPRPVNITNEYALSHSMPTSGNPFSTKQ